MRSRVLTAVLLPLLLAGCARNLADQLLSSDEDARQTAMAKLQSGDVSLKREVISLVAGRLSDGNGNVRRRAVQALARMGPDAVNPLIATLAGGTPKARAAAAEALGLLGADAKAALGPLVEAERDSDDGVRLWAAVALSRIKETLSPSERNLFRLMYGKNEPVAPAANPAPVYPPDDPRALLQGLRSADPKERERLVSALAGKGAAVVPVLLDALKDPAEPVRDGAAWALRLLTEKGEVR